MYDQGWWQRAVGEPWHYYEGVLAVCGRLILSGTPTGGYSAAPYGSWRVCPKCLKHWRDPVLYPTRGRVPR